MEFGLTFKKLSRFCRLNGTCPAVVKMYAQLDKDRLKQPQNFDKASFFWTTPRYCRLSHIRRRKLLVLGMNAQVFMVRDFFLRSYVFLRRCFLFLTFTFNNSIYSFRSEKRLQILPRFFTIFKHVVFKNKK